jgi:hypothetical protein
MNDEQQAQLVKKLSPAISPSEVGRLKTVYVQLKNLLNAFIRGRRIDPKSLPSYKVRRVFVDDTSLTIVTDDRHFVSVSCERDYYDDSVDFSTVVCPDIEDAYAMDILSEEQYINYKEAEWQYAGQCDAESLKDRITDLVAEAGADTIKEYLNELDQ